MDRYRKKKPFARLLDDSFDCAFMGEERNQFVSLKQDIYSLGSLILNLLMTLFKEPEP